MRGVAITLGATVLAAALLVFLDISILDPLLPIGAVFIVLGLAENALGRWGPPHP